MKLQLPAHVATPQDLTALTLELSDYGHWFAHNALKQRIHARSSAAAAPPPELSPAALELIRTHIGTKLLDQPHLDELAKQLEKIKASAPIVTITLAAPAPKKLQRELVEWCRANLSPDILIEFSFNATLLGGMVVRSGSRIFDWSFKRQIMERRATFPEVLRRV